MSITGRLDRLHEEPEKEHLEKKHGAVPNGAPCQSGSTAGHDFWHPGNHVRVAERTSNERTRPPKHALGSRYALLRMAEVAVVGLGKIGLPLAAHFASKGLTV